MNRFSKDLGILDDLLPLTVFDFFVVLMTTFGVLFVPVIINYWLVIPFVPIICFCVYLRHYFLKSFLQIKRIEALCRSPVYVHATNTNTGISTIRACRNEAIILSEYEAHSDCHTQAFFAYTAITRWYALRVSLIIAFYASLIMFVCILTKGIFCKMKKGNSNLFLKIIYK